MIKNKIIPFVMLLATLGLSSCQKWVDDTSQPHGVDESLVFSTEQGFREALNGVYLQLGDADLYGRELTLGMLSLAGRNYDSVSMVKSGPLYYQTATLDLTQPIVKAKSALVWNKMYSAIGNVNNVLDNIEKKKAIFSGRKYQDFKGEALALRAYLHFDLLRLFSAYDMDAAGVPYVSSVNHIAPETKSVKETLAQCMVDFLAAEELLQDQEIATSVLNFWAVKGLIARAYLFQGDNSLAHQYALEIIASKQFALTSKSNTDLLFTKESLFKLYIYNVNYYGYYKDFFGAPRLIGMSVAAQNGLFGTSSVDYRRSFIDATTGLPTGVTLMPKKLTYSSSNVFPLIRLSEMYYIAAECATEIGEGLSYINQVREARNIPALADADFSDSGALTAAIQQEYRKEFMGEGQVFFYFKRKQTPFEQLPFYTDVPVAGKVPISTQATFTFVRTQ